MLAPNDRVIYLEMLRPPTGFRLDQALATTYTLDLASLLLAPLTMTLYNCGSRQEQGLQPLQTLDALRRTSQRLAIFCERGCIKVPSVDQPLYSYLEPAVVEVLPEDAHGTFHPKIWLMRFEKADGAEVLYRYACLSRNLTFDRSWDVALVLEGRYNTRRTRAYPRNRPLSNFLLQLPGLAVEGLSKSAAQVTEQIADEVLRVEFAEPEGFRANHSEMEFMPFPGKPVGAPVLEIKPCRRIVAVSPFLSNEQVQRLCRAARNQFFLVSRQNELDSLSASTAALLKERQARVFILRDDAQLDAEDSPADGGEGLSSDLPRMDDDTTDEDHESPAPAIGAATDYTDTLTDLHAKLFVAEYNERWVNLWVGSANATNAAMMGRNVEFMVRLAETTKVLNIDRMLGLDQKDNASHLSFGSLLHPYELDSVERSDEPRQQSLERSFRLLRRQLAEQELRLVATPAGDDVYDLELKCDYQIDVPAELDELSIRCVPIMISDRNARQWPLGDRSPSVVFERVAGLHLTQFIAFRVLASHDGQEEKHEFVLNVPAEGFPDDRAAQIVRSIIKDPETFLRFLMMLLSPDAIEQFMFDGDGDPFGRQDDRGGAGFSAMPVFEQLVRTFSRNPERIDDAKATIDDLMTDEATRDVIPVQFLELWSVFVTARGEQP